MKKYLLLQFTLALEMKGNKPDFHDAMNPEYSEPFYNDFLDLMRSMYKPEKVKGLHLLYYF